MSNELSFWLLAFGLANLYALAGTSKWYIDWKLRMQDPLPTTLRRTLAIPREERVRRMQRWMRPTLILLVNGGLLWFALKEPS